MSRRSKDAVLSRVGSWPRAMSIDKAAAYLDLSIAAFRKHVSITPSRIGGRVVYDKEKLDEFVDRLDPEKVKGWAEECELG